MTIFIPISSFEFLSQNSFQFFCNFELSDYKATSYRTNFAGNLAGIA